MKAYEKYPPFPLDMLVKCLNSFPDSSIAEKRAFASQVIARHPVLHISCQLHGNVFRARNIEDMPFDKVQDILWPCHQQASDNRFGSMYYVATNQHTALAETEKENRDTVVMVRYVQANPCRIYPAGDEDTISRGGIGFIPMGPERQKLVDDLKELENKDHSAAMAWALQQAFIAEQCASPDRDASKHAFQEIINKYPEIEGISYPSLQRKEGYNLALSTATFIDHWLIRSITKMRVERMPYVYYRMSTLATVVAIDPTGRLTWEVNNGQERMETFLEPKYAINAWKSQRPGEEWTFPVVIP